MSALDARARGGLVKALGEHTFDLLVVGGGITGAGIARDAALRGLSVALCEAEDFAAGTSNRSSKLSASLTALRRALTSSGSRVSA